MKEPTTPKFRPVFGTKELELVNPSTTAASQTSTTKNKLNEDKAQTDINDPQSIEVERIYVTKDFQRKGLGSILMNKAMDIACIQKKAYVWLGVWEKNEKALLFYKRNGFYIIGKHSFFMGEEEQTDFILRKDL